jgi:uncharacterized protein YndB with AHSA1/START domain
MVARNNQPTSFTYTTYIRATPERVWQGLTDPAFMKRYCATNGLVRRPSVRTGRRAPPMTWPTRRSGSS